MYGCIQCETPALINQSDILIRSTVKVFLMWYHVDFYEPSQANAAHMYRVELLVVEEADVSKIFIKRS